LSDGLLSKPKSVPSALLVTIYIRRTITFFDGTPEMSSYLILRPRYSCFASLTTSSKRSRSPCFVLPPVLRDNVSLASIPSHPHRYNGRRAAKQERISSW